uniref:HpcH/HpaI aldolase/citrate lyase domain-containing protein n=1 Tax=Tetradesmus obliquus TaxID=3088 RepID=A0A383VZ87_TETOB|eukprot:jgi/Sobl393_1/8683/SZX70765.1
MFRAAIRQTVAKHGRLVCNTSRHNSISALRRSGRAAFTAKAAAGNEGSSSGNSGSSGAASYGIFVISASPVCAEAVAVSGPDWLCLDAQHGAVGYETLNAMLGCTSAYPAKRIVRVGGPNDRYGIQQALDLGADGVMVPLVNSKEDTQQAVSYCLFPPDGQRSVAYPVRAVYRKGVGVPALAQYLREANREVEVWLQVETRACFEALDEVLSVPGITCAFLGPSDMGFSYGLHTKTNYDLPAMLASPELDNVYSTVVEACNKHGVAPGVFCLGEARAAQLAAQGYKYVAYNTDLGVIMNYSASTLAKLRRT